MERPSLVETRDEVANGLKHAEAGGGLPCGRCAQVGQLYAPRLQMQLLDAAIPFRQTISFAQSLLPAGVD